MHYTRWRRHGDPMTTRHVTRGMTPHEKFERYVPTRGEGCWEWTGKWRSGNGYGVITVDRGEEYAHRWSYRQFNGPIPDGAYIRHTCDNRICCNPAHLLAGTHADNMRDMVDRGRHWMAGQTHCKRGHLLAPPNLCRSRPGHRRICRECSLAADRAKYRKKRLAG